MALCTTVGKLRKSIERYNVYFSTVRYIPYHLPDWRFPATAHEIHPFMHKRSGFSAEQELRILAHDPNHHFALGSHMVGNIGFGPTPKPTPMAERIYLSDWNLLEVADELLIGPYATEDYEREVRETVERLAPGRLRVELSPLHERRFRILR